MSTVAIDSSNIARRQGYSLLQILLHWMIAALVLFQLVFGESMTAAVDAVSEGGLASPFDQQVATLHYWFGLAILAFAALRLAVWWLQGAPEALAATPPWARRLAGAAHTLFYVLLFAVPVTGLLGYYVEGPFGDIHALAKPVFITLIAIHAMAALYHQLWLKDGSLLRMLRPGK